MRLGSQLSASARAISSAGKWGLSPQEPAGAPSLVVSCATQPASMPVSPTGMGLLSPEAQIHE